jgi:hypothetical protein
MLSCVRVSVVCALSVIARAIQKKIRTRALLFLKREQETREEVPTISNFLLFVFWVRVFLLGRDLVCLRLCERGETKKELVRDRNKSLLPHFCFYLHVLV